MIPNWFCSLSLCLMVSSILLFQCTVDSVSPPDASLSKLWYGQTKELKEATEAALDERLPDDAAPLDYQVFRYMAAEPKSMDQGVSIYVAGGSEFLFERLAMFGLNGELIPGAAENWVSSEDGT